MATATPTPSSAGFRVVTVGTGQTYSTLTDFFNYLATQNLVTNQEILCAEVYNNQTIAGRVLGPISANDDYYCLVRPVPGYGVNELDPTGALDYGTVGIEVVFSNNSPSKYRNGLLMRNFNISLSGAGGFETMKFTKEGQSNSVSSLQGFDRCRVLVDTPNSTRAALDVGDNGGIASFTDTLTIFGSTTTTPAITGSNVRIQRLTFARRGSAGQAIGGLSGTSFVQDSLFSNMGAKAIGSIQGSATITKNVSNNSADTGVSGFTVASGDLVTSATDFRPKAGSIAIGGASTGSAAFLDLRNNNRGNAPDSGAVQLAVLLPAPTGMVTSQPNPDGQSIGPILFSTTGNPTSGMASFMPADTNPNGAVAKTGVVSFGTNNGQVAATVLEPGNYKTTITITSANGTSNVSGTQPFSINSISGNPQAPDPGTTTPPTDTTAPVLSSPTGVATGVTTATVGVTTNEGNGTLYALVNTSATATTTAIKAGLSQTVSSTGNKTFDVTGLTANTTYYAHFLQRDSVGNESTVMDSAAFTTQPNPVTPNPSKVVYLVNGRLRITIS